VFTVAVEERFGLIRRTRPAGWGRAVAARVRRIAAHRRAPLVALILVTALGTAARAYNLGIPAYARPGKGYVFDERYYVPAARSIEGKINKAGETYAGAAPLGADPNAEHPQLGKMLIAGGMVVFGDNAVGWRITAVIFGALSILLLYWLVRSAGGGPWLAVLAALLAASENLWIVSSRIAVLDIFVVPFMLAGLALYLRRSAVVGAVVIGVGCCVKEFAVYAVIVVILLELMRALAADRSVRAFARRMARPLAVAVITGFTYITLLAVLDGIVTPYSGGHPVDRGQSSFCDSVPLWGGACNHIVFMQTYAAKLQDVGGPHGIASEPTKFWLDEKDINYFKVAHTVTTRTTVTKIVHSGAVSHKEVVATRVVTKSLTTLWFRGYIGRVLLFTAWLAILLNLWWAIRRRDDLSFLVVAWVLGTWLPPALFHLIDNRTTYLYYMVVTMPALYIGVARLLTARRVPRWLLVIWLAAMFVDTALLYPFRTLSGS
jgi:4-amino-4-deoxy-L-arabinose transferase-like glycosyltransferase